MDTIRKVFRGKNSCGVVLTVLILLLVFTITNQKSTITAKTNGTDLTFSSPSSKQVIAIPYSKIKSVELRSSFEFGREENGTQTEDYRFGVWNNEEFGTYYLAVLNNITEVIVLQTADNTYVFNFENREGTESLCRELQSIST